MSSNSDEPSTSGIGFIGTSKEPPRKKRKVADLSIDVSCSNSNISHAFVGAGTANHAFYQYNSTERGGTTLYFIHQTLQEYLAALYIHYVMSDDEFAEFVERKLFHSHWIVVRKFLFGIIFDLYKNTDTSQRRKGLMKNALVQEIQKNPDFEKREVETLDE